MLLKRLNRIRDHILQFLIEGKKSNTRIRNDPDPHISAHIPNVGHDVDPKIKSIGQHMRSMLFDPVDVLSGIPICQHRRGFIQRSAKPSLHIRLQQPINFRIKARCQSILKSSRAGFLPDIYSTVCIGLRISADAGLIKVKSGNKGLVIIQSILPFNPVAPAALREEWINGPLRNHILAMHAKHPPWQRVNHVLCRNARHEAYQHKENSKNAFQFSPREKPK